MIYLFQYLVQLFKQYRFSPNYHFHLLETDTFDLSKVDFCSLASILWPSGVDSSLTAQASINVGLHNQTQRDNAIQMPELPDAMRTQVSAV